MALWMHIKWTRFLPSPLHGAQTAQTGRVPACSLTKLSEAQGLAAFQFPIKHKPVPLHHWSCTLSTLDGSSFPRSCVLVPSCCGLGLCFPGTFSYSYKPLKPQPNDTPLYKSFLSTSGAIQELTASPSLPKARPLSSTTPLITLYSNHLLISSFPLLPPVIVAFQLFVPCPGIKPGI